MVLKWSSAVIRLTELTELKFTLANSKERRCLRLFYIFVIWTEFFSWVFHETESVKTRATPHEQKGSFLLDLIICGLLRN